jgi:hypothetical protein
MLRRLFWPLFVDALLLLACALWALWTLGQTGYLRH